MIRSSLSSRNRGHYSETTITPEESPCRSLLRLRLSQGCTLAGSLNLQAVRKRRFFALCFRLRFQSLPLRMTFLCDAFVFSFRRHQGTALRIGFPSRGSSRLCRVMRCCSLPLNRFSKVALLSAGASPCPTVAFCTLISFMQKGLRRLTRWSPGLYFVLSKVRYTSKPTSRPPDSA